jgi:hypothetical protein
LRDHPQAHGRATACAAVGEVEFIGHGAHIDRPEAPRLPAYPRPRGSSRAVKVVMSWLVRFQGRVFIRVVRLSRLIGTAKNTRRNTIAARSRTAAAMIGCTPSNGGGDCARWFCGASRGAGCAGLRGGSRRPRRSTTSSRCRRKGRTSWTTCSRFARAATARRRRGIPDGLGGEMPPGGRGGEILPGVALRGAPAAALAPARNSLTFHKPMS